MEQPNKQDLFKKWSEKLGLPLNIIEEDFKKSLEKEKALHPDTELTTQEQRALQLLATSYKKQLRSPAVGFEGMIIAATDSMNFNAKRVREAEKLYKEDSDKAIQEGITDTEGTPLDNRAEFSTGNANPGYGKPLPRENWSRTIYGVASQIGKDGEPKAFTLHMRNAVATNENIPIFVPVKFRAINKSEENASTLSLNSSSFTEFENYDGKLPEPQAILERFFAENIIPLYKLQEYHTSNKDDYNRLAIITGDVSLVDLNPTSVGSRRISVEDSDNLDIDTPGLTCWIPPRIPLDFSEQSKIIIIGRTGQGKDKEDGTQGDLMLNTFGIYALPEYKISPDIQPLTEDNTEINEESSESK